MAQMIYMDNAATSFPKPGRVYDYMCEFFRTHGVNPGRSGYDASLEAEEMVLGTRKMLTEFFGGVDCSHLTFSYNASDSLNMIIQGMTEKGDHKEARGVFEELCSAQRTAGSLILLAETLLELGESKEAVKRFDDAIRIEGADTCRIFSGRSKSYFASRSFSA